MLIESEPDKLLMIPGPTPVMREILSDLAEPTISHTSAAIAEIIVECQTRLRTVAGTENAAIFLFGGSGTLAQEAAVVNLVAPGERLLVVSNGYFGDRFVPMAEAHGVEVVPLRAEWGESVTPDELDAALSRMPCQAVTITHVETSTGAKAPVADLAAVARRHNAAVILDAVCGLAGAPVEMDAWGIDLVLTGAQKALGVPPGLSILLVSADGMERRRSRDRVSSYYADLLNWEASMQDPRTYFSTHAVNLFYALRRGLQVIEEEGLEERFARHRALARSFRAGMTALGFGSLTGERWLAPTMSVVSYPDSLDDAAFLAPLAELGVIAAGCLGSFRGRGARFGHMGNITGDDLLRALAAVEQVLLGAGLEVERGRGVAAAMAALEVGD
jgi:aspartate aminotransferase-like enzyme